MKRLILAAALLLLAAPAYASGWEAYHDCGDGLVPIFRGWHGKIWLTVEGDHEIILDNGVFKNLGVRDEEEPLNADQTDFDFAVKWRGETKNIHWHGTDGAEVSLDDKACHSMGDSRYEGEAQKYEEEKKK